MKIGCLLPVLGLVAIAAIPASRGQTPKAAPSNWNLNFAYDAKLNSPVALTSYSIVSAHSPYLLPQFTLETVAFGGTELSGTHSDVIAGFGESLAYTYKSLTFSGFVGQGFSASQSPHLVIGAGFSLPIQ